MCYIYRPNSDFFIIFNQSAVPDWNGPLAVCNSS
jgi:hypothetical protein